MDCVYCHREGCRENSELPFHDVIKIIERSMALQTKNVRLTGGEPLLHSEVGKICQEVKNRFPNVKLGINTNAVLIDDLLHLVGAGLIDCVVVGIDYYDNHISKKSKRGCSSGEILNNILRIKSTGCETNISTVFTGDTRSVEKLTNWCFENKIRIKILEIVNDEVADEPTLEYRHMVEQIVDKFNLRVMYNIAKKQYSAVSERGGVVNFFHNHCRLRECDVCTKLFLRVTSNGMTSSCLQPNTPQFSLLDDDAYKDGFLAGLNFLGIPPEMYTEQLSVAFSKAHD